MLRITSFPLLFWVIIVFILCNSFSYQGYSQKQAYFWYFGKNAGLDFTGFDPVPLTNSQMDASEGVAAISDSAGKLLFYTDGVNIWNSNHVRCNSASLSGDRSSTQSATIVPDPDTLDQYFVFTTKPFDSGSQTNYGGNFYKIRIKSGETGSIMYDYAAATGKGGLWTGSTEKFVAVPFTYGANKIGYWFLMHEFDNNRFIKIKYDGILRDPIVQDIGVPHRNSESDDGTNRGAAGQMKVNDLGTRIALAVEGGKFFEIFRFNPVTGVISNPMQIPAGYQDDKFAYRYGAYGVEFSPTGAYGYEATSGNYLYGTTREGGQIIQWDLSFDFDRSQFIKNGRIIYSNPEIQCGALQMAPNGKIYVAFDGQDFLGVINSPMRPDCRFEQNGARLIDNDTERGGLSGLGLPAAIPVDKRPEPFYFENLCFGDETLFYITDQNSITPNTPKAWIFTKLGGGGGTVTKTSLFNEYTYNFPTAGNYRVTLRVFKSGNPVNYSRDLTINPLPVVKLAAQDRVPLCMGSSLELDAGPGAFYDWEDVKVKVRSRTITTDSLHSLLEYRVKVKDYHGCVGWDTLWVEKKAPPTIDTTYSLKAFCGEKNGSATVVPKGSVLNYNYQWEGFPEVTSNSLTGVNGGNYIVHVLLKSTGCEVIDTILVGDIPKPLVTISSTNDLIFPGQAIQLSAHGAMRYEWIHPHGLTSDTIFVNPWEETTYLVVGFNSAIDSTACSDTSSITIKMKPNGPDWALISANLPYGQIVTAKVFINQLPVSIGYGKIGAFKGDECCGLKVGAEVGPDGSFLFTFPVFSSQLSGTVIGFKYWDPLKDTVYEIFEKIAFNFGDNIGSPSSPFSMNGYDQIKSSRLLSPDWNWFSLNIRKPAMLIGDILGSLNKRERDLIKSQFSSATYYPEYGWFGDLTEISPDQTYKIHLGAPGYLSYQGYPANAKPKSISIKKGWNWIGFPPSNPMNINQALESMVPEEGDYIESRMQSAMYYNDVGWYGGLSSLEPLQGYMLKTDHDANLTYPNGGSSVRLLVSNHELKTGSIANPYFNPYRYKFTGNIAVSVNKDGQNIGNEENDLVALINGVPCGMSKGMLFPPTNAIVYNLLVYSNVESGELIQFKFYEKKNDNWLVYSESVEFYSDMILGNALQPYILRNYTSDVTAPDKNPTSLTIYPNPSDGRVVITYQNRKPGKIEALLCDIFGRVVQDISNRFNETNEISFELDLSGVASGVYFIIINGDRSEKYPIIIR